MSQNIWRSVDYESLSNQSDITLEEDQMKDVVSDDEAREKSRMSFRDLGPGKYFTIFFHKSV